MTQKLFIGLVLFALNAYADEYTFSQDSLTGDETVCFAHDYSSEHTAGENDISCRRYYYRGEGACASHARGNAKKMCKLKSDNPKSCDLDTKLDCFPLTAVPSDAVLVGAE